MRVNTPRLAIAALFLPIRNHASRQREEPASGVLSDMVLLCRLSDADPGVKDTGQDV